MFGFRNHQSRNGLERIPSQKMRVLISGSTGLIGKQLCAFYACMGHEVHRLVRRLLNYLQMLTKKYSKMG